MFIVINLYFVAIKEDFYFTDVKFIKGFIIAQTVLNFLCFFEVIFGVIIYGPYEAFRKLFRAWIECLIFFITILAFIKFLTSDLDDLVSVMKLYELTIFIRMLRLLTMLSEFGKFRVIIETLKNLMGPFWTILCVMFTIFYVFGIIGSFLYGGIIQSDTPRMVYDTSTPDIYVLNNFNDLASGFVTLFELMVVNNWMVTTNMYVVVYGTAWVRFYFVFFYFFAVVIGINIVVAFAIDMFGSIERLDSSQ